MLIAYDTLMELKPEKFGEKVRLAVCNSGMQRGICITLDTNDFRVEYEEGKAKIYLSRSMTNGEARELAAALLKAASDNEEMEKAYTVVTQNSQEIPLPPGVTFVGHGG